MDLRPAFTAALTQSMKDKDAPRTSTLRMILARVKDLDIAARPAADRVPDVQIEGALRGMIKQRREAAALYVQGNRPELGAKEEAEIALIESFLPRQLDEPATEAAVDAAVVQTSASGPKDMGRVMAALRAAHGSALDMTLVNRLVKQKLAA